MVHVRFAPKADKRETSPNVRTGLDSIFAVLSQLLALPGRRTVSTEPLPGVLP